MATIIGRESDRHATASHAVRPVAFSFDDLSDRAEHYLADVRVEAARIIQQAKSDAEQIRKQAEVEGRRAAEQAASKVLDERVAEQMSHLRPALEGAVAQLVDARGAWIDHWQNSAVQLAAAMAERLVRRSLDSHPDVTIEWIREALELAAGAAEVVLHLHPSDIEALGEQIDRVTETLSNLSSARVLADEAIDRGGCVIHTRFGRIDQQVKPQLDRLIAEFN